jgi:hypothetical protein
MDAFQISGPRKFNGIIKVFNSDGFKVLISTSWVSEFSSLILSEFETLAEVSIDLGIKNSMLLATEIIDDDSISIKTKIAFALIAPITQSAMRMRAIIRRIPESELKRSLIPMLTKIAQAGMQNIHTPAHYQSSFPSMGLIGKLILVVSSLEKNIRLSEEKESKEVTTYSLEVESKCETNSKPLEMFPSNVMFPGLGGIFMEESMQNSHMDWCRNYFDNVVVGTNFDEGWYSLTAADTHPWFDISIVVNAESKEYESMSFKQVSDTSMTEDNLKKTLVTMLSFRMKRAMTITF